MEKERVMEYMNLYDEISDEVINILELIRQDFRFNNYPTMVNSSENLEIVDLLTNYCFEDFYFGHGYEKEIVLVYSACNNIITIKLPVEILFEKNKQKLIDDLINRQLAYYNEYCINLKLKELEKDEKDFERLRIKLGK